MLSERVSLPDIRIACCKRAAANRHILSTVSLVYFRHQHTSHHALYRPHDRDEPTTNPAWGR